MALSRSEIEYGKRFSIISLFMSSIHKKNYSVIQKFYDLTQVGNVKLLERFHQKRQVGLFSTEQIYMDIVYIILDEIISKRDIEEVFIETFKDSMPDVYKKAEEAVVIASNGGVFSPTLKESLSKNERQWYYRYLLYELGALDLLPQEAATMFAQGDYNNYQRQYVLSESEVSHNKQSQYVFYDTDESIFSSPLFDKMLRKRKSEMAEYLNIDSDDFCNYVHNNMKVSADYGTTETMVSDKDLQYAEVNLGSGYARILNELTMNLIGAHGGGNDWLAFMTNDVTNMYKVKGYRPDVDALMRYYYTCLVMDKYEWCEENGEPFNKIFLSRECKGSTVLEDIYGIFAAYEVDVLCQMMMYIYEDYYRNFSWEQITNNKVADRYNIIINQLNNIIAEKNDQINRLSNANSVLKLQTTHTNDEAIIQIARKNDELIKEIDSKDAEIRKLKETIESYELFINELEKDENNDDVEDSVDIELLKAKRYLFVGNIGSDFDELKRQFPNSIFMSNNTMNLSNINVDAIVMVIKRMSHSMFYKIKSTSIYQEVPCVKSNAIKADGVISDMWKQMKNN